MAPFGWDKFDGRKARTVSLISVGNVNTKKAKKEKKQNLEFSFFLIIDQRTSCTSK
jgi:hypothetical protein